MRENYLYRISAISINNLCLMLLLLSCPFRSLAAPPDFTLSIAVQNETCPGNGQLSISVSGTDPAASMFYKVYKLPDLVNSNTEQAAPVITGLSAGTYRVIAIQTVGGESNSQQADAVIGNGIAALAFTISSTGSSCQNDGTMTVSVFGGVGVQYEIISGPVTAPLQSSATFTNLPAGVYQVRVFDNCGEGWVATHTLFPNPGALELEGPSITDNILPSCNTVLVANSVTVDPAQSIIYPLAVQYTIYPPGGGAPIVINTTVATGPANELELLQEFPFYNDQPITYDLTVTDGCGNTYSEPDIVLNLKFISELRTPPAECGQNFINVASSNFVPPLTVEFVSFPAGFVPTDFNAGHPGPFMDDSIDYGGFTQPVPPGYYSANITDSCGRTVFAETEVQPLPPEPAADLVPYPGCQSYMSEVTIRIPGFIIVGGSITEGPPEYSSTYPVNVSQFANDEGELEIPFLHAGDYTIELLDDCGNTYIFEFTVPPLATQVTATARTGCQIGFGSIRVRGSGTALTNAQITVAPAEFGQSLPFDASGFISAGGILSLQGLPPGLYKVTVTDNCDITHQDLPVTVTGYAVTQNTYSITPYCGSFDLQLNHVSNASTAQTFWLQKKDPATGQWMHPETGVPYVDGTPPNGTNSFNLVNMGTTYNISYLGDFRILKVFEAFGDGNQSLFVPCIEIIQEFTFINDIEIVDIQKTTCNGTLSSVAVTAEGIAPITYFITTLNGNPFPINNGTNNVFADLAPGVYNFQVFDACGNVGNRIADIAELPSLAIASQPGDLSQCDDGARDGIASFDFTVQDSAVIGAQNPALFTVTYHISQTDAESGSNPLPVPYATGNATIYARLVHSGGSGCYDVVSFEVTVFDYPMPDIVDEYVLCENQTVTLFGPPGFVSYNWSTMQTGQAITVDEPGVYWVEVSDGTCSGIAQITVSLSAPPEVDHIETVDWTASDNSITVVLASGSGAFEFSIDGQNWQDSNFFGGLPPGEYTVHVRDKGRCGVVTETVVLLHYPVYFTPNGDGYHDTWHIPYAFMEPDMNIFIFDRYGKLLKNLLPQSAGWDGTYNGQPMPSTDYWFTVKRQDGRLLRGHFAMKR